MSDMRSCIKPQCRWPAVATLSYRYLTSEVWLSDLGVAHPATHDLCPHHADSFTVPRGWTLVDDRDPAEPVREPSAAEIVERETRKRAAAPVVTTPEPPPRPPSRYSALLASLPTYVPGEADEPMLVGAVPAAGATMADSSGPPPTPPAVPRRPQSGSVLGRHAAPRPPAHALAPVIRARAADLAGPIVGTIEIDLESDGLTPHASEARPVEHGADPQDHPAQSVVLQLPLPRWSIDGD